MAGKNSSGEAVPSCVAFRVKFEIKDRGLKVGEAPARIIRMGKWGREYREALKLNVSGGAYAVLRVCVNADNSLRGEPELITSSFNEKFDVAVIKAASEGRYEAGAIAGEPRPGCTTFSSTSFNAIAASKRQIKAVEKIIPELRRLLPFTEDGVTWRSVRSKGANILWAKEFQSIPSAGLSEEGLKDLFREAALKEAQYYCSSRRFRDALKAGVNFVTEYRAGGKLLFGIVVTDEGCRKK